MVMLSIGARRDGAAVMMVAERYEEKMMPMVRRGANDDDGDRDR